VVTEDLTGASPVAAPSEASETDKGNATAASALAALLQTRVRAALTTIPPASTVEPTKTSITTGIKERVAALVAQAGEAADSAAVPSSVLDGNGEARPDGQDVSRRTAAGPAETLLDAVRARAAATAVSTAVADAKNAQKPDASVVNLDASALRAYANAGRSEGSGDGSASITALAPEAVPKAGATVRDAGVSFGFDGAFTGHKGETALAPATTNFSVSLANASDPASLPSDTVNQIVQAIRLQWNNGTSEAHITLQPEQFGEVTVSIRVERGQVVARVEADAPVVREWLQSNQATLRHGLAEQNLTLDRLEVTEPPESRDADRRGSRQNPDEQPRRQPRRPLDEDAFEVVA
jgi:flagellar hook-length control protein FliK